MRSADELAALAGVVRAVRAELADRDDDAIPNKLRKAAGATGRTVPAPHQRAMLDHIASDEQFRAAVRDRWEAAGESDALTDRFLADPVAAEPLVQAAAATIASKRAEDERDAALREVSRLEQQLSEAKTRLSDAKREAEEDRKRQSASDRRSREGLERSIAAAKADLAASRGMIAGLNADLGAERAKVEDANLTIKRLTERETRRSVSAQPSAPRPTGALPKDPVALAAWLDQLERRLRYYRNPARDSSVDGTADSDEPFRLPLGISPESREAIDAIVNADVDRIIIDGYNVAGAVLFDAFSTRAGREAAVARAEMLKRGTSASVTVVFDAAKVKGRSRFETDHGVQVMFEPETSADDAIELLVAERADRCAVITSDRELQSRVERPDCVVVFTTALIAWSEHLNER